MGEAIRQLPERESAVRLAAGREVGWLEDRRGYPVDQYEYGHIIDAVRHRMFMQEIEPIQRAIFNVAKLYPNSFVVFVSKDGRTTQEHFHMPAELRASVELLQEQIKETARKYGDPLTTENAADSTKPDPLLGR